MNHDPDVEIVNYLYSVGEDTVHINDVHRLNDVECVYIKPFLFTFGIITSIIGDVGPSNRWCFESYDAARIALTQWLEHYPEQAEPIGWHRHPNTGRRRVHGDPATEYVEY